jgi:hypothetical protein
VFVVDGVVRSVGAIFRAPPAAEVRGGYWIVPISLVLGLGILTLTHRGARRFLSWWRSRRSPGPWPSLPERIDID